VWKVYDGVSWWIGRRDFLGYLIQVNGNIIFILLGDKAEDDRRVGFYGNPFLDDLRLLDGHRGIPYDLGIC